MPGRQARPFIDFCNKICQKPTFAGSSACDPELVKACGGSQGIPLWKTTYSMRVLRWMVL